MEMFENENMSMVFKENGNKAFRQRKYEEAIEEYTFALQVNDTNPVFYTNRAQAFLRLGKAMFAAQDCRHALKLKPDFVKAFIHLAKALKELGAFQEAIATLERAEEFSNDEQASVVKTYKLEILEEQTKNISLAKDQQASKWTIDFVRLQKFQKNKVFILNSFESLVSMFHLTCLTFPEVTGRSTWL